MLYKIKFSKNLAAGSENVNCLTFLCVSWVLLSYCQSFHSTILIDKKKLVSVRMIMKTERNQQDTAWETLMTENNFTCHWLMRESLRVEKMAMFSSCILQSVANLWHAGIYLCWSSLQPSWTSGRVHIMYKNFNNETSAVHFYFCMRFFCRSQYHSQGFTTTLALDIIWKKTNKTFCAKNNKITCFKPSQ